MTVSLDPRAGIVAGYRPIGGIIPRHWQVGDITANGITQRYYRTGGAKPPLVLLHGIMEGALAWLPTARVLEAEYDVVMLDARAHGHSGRVEGDFGSDTLAEDVVGALQCLGLSGVRLLGFSLGATTAAWVADRHPELVHSLVLAGLAKSGSSDASGESGTAGAIGDAPGYQAWLSAYTAWLEGLKGQIHAQRMLSGLTQLPPGAPLPQEEEYVAWIENCALLDLELVRMSGKLWSRLGPTVAATDAAIARLACTTLIMKSGFGQYSSGALELREERGAVPGRLNITVLHFENTGHVIYRDRFDAFVEQVRAFFGRDRTGHSYSIAANQV